MDKIIDALWEGLSGINASTIALIVILLLIGIITWLYKNRKDIGNAWNWLYNKRKNEEENQALLKELAESFSAFRDQLNDVSENVKKHTDKITALEEQANKNKECIEHIENETHDNTEHVKEYEGNRKHDREQSFEKQRMLTDQISGIGKSVDSSFEKLNARLDILYAANRVILGDRINSKYKQYLSQKYIPDDEYDEFVNIHSIYNLSGGNHSGDSKYNYCMEHLPILPSEIKNEVEHG